ncbi:MAG: GTPase Era [Candidatus Rokubacteria bacterium]|nr:GTPase Era [Candidatus Rokubacteria bacterium]
MTPATRAGFIALIGRPNAGKSTLLNRLVGEKLAIVSPRPQTTRNRVTGILTRRDAQVIFVDTPGLHPGGGKLGAFMMETVERAVEDVDAVCLVVDATAREQPDPIALRAVAEYRGPLFCALNKTDRLAAKSRLLPAIDRWRTARPFEEIVPISALTGTNCDRLLERLVAALPEHPFLFPEDATSDQPETFYVAEIIREQIFHRTHQEVPYAAAVRVDELVDRPKPPCVYVRATVFVEQDSQRGILIGKQGAMLKSIGTAARQTLEAFFGVKVFLELTVQVRRNWRKDERALREFGLMKTS